MLSQQWSHRWQKLRPLSQKLPHLPACAEVLKVSSSHCCCRVRRTKTYVAFNQRNYMASEAGQERQLRAADVIAWRMWRRPGDWASECRMYSTRIHVDQLRGVSSLVCLQMSYQYDINSIQLYTWGTYNNHGQLYFEDICCAAIYCP